MTGAYYNEWEPYPAQWLRNLIAAGLIPAGDVDERSICDVQPDDLRGYVQCHWFAGLGGWAYAARLAGWPDDRPIWTGSCPCQPYSVAGKGKGADDKRHLWPDFFRLIRAARPAVVIGEQVAAAIGKGWLDGVCSDLEGIGYACGAAVVPACAVNTPHRRDRLWFVADANCQRSQILQGQSSNTCQEQPPAIGDGRCSDVANADSHRFEAGCSITETLGYGCSSDADGGSSPLADSLRGGCAGRSQNQIGYAQQRNAVERPGAWDDAEWLDCADGKRRRVKPGICLLVDGFSGRVAVQRATKQGKAEIQEAHWYNRVGALQALGNAIVPQLGAEIIKAYLECRP